jgi:hypothetical protein
MDGRYAIFAGAKNCRCAQTAFPPIQWLWGGRIARSHWAGRQESYSLAKTAGKGE